MGHYMFEVFDPDAFNKTVPVSHGSSKASMTARLSSFSMPDQVFAPEPENDSVEIRFSYPNSEPSERTPRRVDDRFSVLLGRHSRKIIACIIREPADWVAKGAHTFDPEVCKEWLDELSTDRQFAARRNAEVVSAIIQSMPTRVKRMLGQQSRRGKNTLDRF